MDQDGAALIALASRRGSSCPVCDYNLSGLVEPRCPECGSALRLEIGSENLRLGPWLLAMLGPALAMGFDGVVSVLAIFGIMINPPRGRGDVTVAAVLLGVFVTLVVACGLVVATLVRRRKAWHRRPLRAQWRAAVIILVTVFMVHLVFGGVLTQSLH